jgi:cyclophilin family peptidyl-prolyl cis-trans isomerase
MISFKKVGKIACVAASVCAAAFSAVFAGCTLKTNHPTVRFTVSFNGTSYELNYKLYRNMYPQTVQHFIELADAGYYDNTVIHNYVSGSYLYGGGYSYDATAYASLLSNGADSGYFNTQSKLAKYLELFNSGILSPTVYAALDGDGKPTNALPTLYGEFSDQGHTVENGAVTPAFGTLRMYYETQSSLNKQIYTVSGKNEILTREYRNNAATSFFSIQLSSSTSSDSTHCTFGVLKSDSDETALTSLTTAISDYISDNLSSASDFVTSGVSATVRYYFYDYDGDENIDVSYTITKVPIIIQSVSVTGY